MYPQYGYGADFIPRNLALLPQGIMFIYDLYSIGCYTDGTQRVTLPLSKIRHLLKPRALTYFENWNILCTYQSCRWCLVATIDMQPVAISIQPILLCLSNGWITGGNILKEYYKQNKWILNSIRFTNISIKINYATINGRLTFVEKQSL